MATTLSVTHQFSAPPSTVFALLTDRDFLDRRLAETGGDDPSVVSLERTVDGTTVVTRQSIPASALPSMVASLIQGDPVTERTESWRPNGDGYAADLNVVIKGAPASLKGTMALDPAGAGCSLTIDGQASVPIPLFGSKIEAVVVEQVTDLITKENEYTAATLSS